MKLDMTLRDLIMDSADSAAKEAIEEIDYLREEVTRLKRQLEWEYRKNQKETGPEPRA